MGLAGSPTLTQVRRRVAPALLLTRPGALQAWLTGILLAGLAARVALLPVTGFPTDQEAKRIWATRLLTLPTKTFYDAPDAAALNPGETWLLWFVANLYHLFSPELPIDGDSFGALLKLVPLIADLAIVFLLFALGNRLAGPKAGLIAASAYALNPAVIFLSAVWGGWGSVGGLAALAALWFTLRGRLEFAFPALVFAVLFRPAYVALAPFLLIVCLWRSVAPHLGDRWRPPIAPRVGDPEPWRRSARRGVVATAASLAVAWVVLLPFSIGIPPLATRWTAADRLGGALAGNGYATVNAFTLWWPLAGNWEPDDRRVLLGLSAQTWGIVLLLLVYAAILRRFWRGQWEGGHSLLWALFATTLAQFTLPTRGHERDLFPALLFGVAAAAVICRLRWTAVVLAITGLANLAFAFDLYADLPAPAFLGAGWFAALAAFANLAVLAYLLLLAAPARRRGRASSPLVRQIPLWPDAVWPISSRQTHPLDRWRSMARAAALPVLFGGLALALRLPNIDTPERMYFDEIYFVTTAQGYATGNPDAHINYVNAPYGSAYEWTHPPLGKILIAAGIRIVGDNPIGWRLPGMLAGAIGVALAYLLGLRLTGSRLVGVFAASLLLVDGLFLTMTRIATVDGFVTVFTMGALLAVHRFLLTPAERVRRPLVMTGLLLGLALSTKWNAAYVAGLIGLVVVARAVVLAYRWRRTRGDGLHAAAWPALRAHLIWIPIGLGVVPLTMYLLAYAPFFLTGHTLRQMIDLQEAMFRYHAAIVPNHPFRSAWWHWPLAVGRMWFYSDRSDGVVRSIYVNGNPLLFLSFVPAVLGVALVWWRSCQRAALLVLAIGFFGPWLPWAVSPRAEAFVYHFLPAVPWGCLAIAVALAALWRREGARRWVAGGYLALAIAIFLFVYPMQTAQPMTEARVEMRVQFDDWWRGVWRDDPT